MPSMMIKARAKPDRVDELRVIQRQLMRDVAAHEPGCEVFEVRQMEDDPLTFVWFMSFADEESFARYSDADYHTSTVSPSLECIEGEPVTQRLVDFR